MKKKLKKTASATSSKLNEFRKGLNEKTSKANDNRRSTNTNVDENVSTPSKLQKNQLPSHIQNALGEDFVQ